MAALPVYSKRLVWRHNTTGPQPYTNDTGNTLIVRNFTAFYNGSSGDILELVDESDAVMLFVPAAGSIIGPSPTFQIWEELHLVWPDGITWSVNSASGWDYTIHGYELSG
jgi:hypothetical protein